MWSKEIQPELKRLIDEATRVEESGLATRLIEIDQWIGNQKRNLFNRRKIIMDFLLELEVHVNCWLDYKFLSISGQEHYIDDFTPAERYWYQVLFPRWFNTPETNLFNLLQTKEFDQSYDKLINLLAMRIEGLQGPGAYVRGYILDMSMATTFVTTSSSKQPLCVKIDTRNPHGRFDISYWKTKLREYGIKRGYFITCLDAKRVSLEDINNLADLILDKSNTLPPTCYDGYNL